MRDAIISADAISVAGKTRRGKPKNGSTMMRFRAEQRSDGSYEIYDTHKGEICATRSIDQMLAERWAETFDAAYAAFRDEANSFPSAGRTSDTPQGDGRHRLPGVETTIEGLLPVSESEPTGPAPATPSEA